MTRTLLVVAGAAAILVAAFEIGRRGNAETTPAAVSSAVVARVDGDDAHEAGRRIWNARCYFCHGYSGDAKTVAATFLTPPPRDFHAVRTDTLSREAMLEAVTHGRPGTAMAAFASVLDADERAKVVDFVRTEFMTRKAANTRYHTPENGWPDHERYRAAFPWATGAVDASVSWDDLSSEAREGRRLYRSACVTCHDRPSTQRADDLRWELRGVSWPPGNYERDHDESHGAHETDGKPHPGGAPAHAPQSAGDDDPYERHEIPPRIAGLTASERLGEKLYQAHCAHCHAEDGTGRNWRGSFLEPHPPDFTAGSRRDWTVAKVAAATRDGVPGASMPAWKGVLPSREIDAIARYVVRAFPVAP